MSTAAELTKLEPDVSRLGDALKVLSDELPRISNLDSTAILHILQGVQDDLRYSVRGQNDLSTLLDNRLTRIQDTLTSLECRIGRLEQPAVSSLQALENADNKTAAVKVENRDVSEPR